MGSSLTYPVPQIRGTESMTTEQIHQLLRTQPLIAKRIRTLAEQRFISDALLKGRFKSVGGVVLYENGEPLFAPDDPESIMPGGEYPRSQVTAGDLAAARVEKWGRDVPVTDESIGRRGIDVVNRSLNQLVNRMVKFVDSAALGVIASKVTTTSAASGAWTTAAAIVKSVELAKAGAEESGEGHTIDTIVLKPTAYATVMSIFLDAGLLPREASNPLITGAWPQVLDLTWLRSPHTPTSAPMLVDTDELGGMADEDLGGPGYTKSLPGVEVKSIREDLTDGYLLRSRRVTVPVVTDATAGLTITGTGL
ncbi:phage major capsid protein [Lysinibacter cavernae]|uniref:Phage major capsid protein n=1 Tax=Lysinibacter cavernae TaxID=1640652 RepID=A0A7X5QZ46_9MICO|nr:hypothetical protein [Lysinibacter cavernae]NIH52542.1 hypothetical protein [Lysinibacter cavernae]